MNKGTQRLSETQDKYEFNIWMFMNWFLPDLMIHKVGGENVIWKWYIKDWAKPGMEMGLITNTL